MIAPEQQIVEDTFAKFAARRIAEDLYIGKHRRPAGPPLRTDGRTSLLKRSVLAVSSLLVLLGTVAASCVLHVPAVQASTVTHTSAWWDTATCKALTAYERHPSGRRFAAVVADGRHADQYLKVDTAGWAKHRTAARLYYIQLDCSSGADSE